MLAALLASREISEALLELTGADSLPDLKCPSEFPAREQVHRLIVDLIYQCSLVRAATKENDRLRSWSDASFLRELPQEYHAIYESQLRPAECHLLTLHLENIADYLRPRIASFEAEFGPMKDLDSSTKSMNELKRACVYSCLDNLETCRNEIEALEQDFDGIADDALEAAERSGFLLEIYSTLRGLKTLKLSLATDAGVAFEEWWYGDIGNLEVLPDPLVSANRRYPVDSNQISLYMSRKGDELLNDLFSPGLSGQTDLSGIRSYLRNAVEYFQMCEEDLAESQSSGWLDRTRLQGEASNQLLADDYLWRHLNYVGWQAGQIQDTVHNIEALKPIVVQRGMLNLDKREIVSEIYTAFIVGNYLSVFALSRALVERIVKERATRGRIDLVAPSDPRGKYEKSLETLIHEVAEVDDVIRERKDWLLSLKKEANVILHRRRKFNARDASNLAKQRLELRSKALTVINECAQLLQNLYRVK